MMKRLLIALFCGVCLSASAAPSLYPDSSPATPFGQQYFDTPLVKPKQFSQSHALDKAPVYAKQLCHVPGLHCVSIKPSETWVHLFPTFNERYMMMRLNRMNVALAYRNWLLVPKDWHHLNNMALSPMPLHRATHGHKLLLIDLKKFAFGAYDKKGNLLRWGPASGGRAWCPMLHQSCKSATGFFRIYRKRGLDCRSSKYPIVTKGGAPMPYCMFYHGGYAIHASSLSGFINHSRGCIRLFFDDAKWLNTAFTKIGTRVLVKA